MIGRAGRYGLSTAGESFLFCSDKARGLHFINSAPEHVKPQLFEGDQQKVLGFVLEAVVTGLTNSPSVGGTQLADVQGLLRHTLAWQQLQPSAEDLVAKLVNDDMLIKVTVDCETFVQYTQLGCAAVFASFTPKQAMGIWKTLVKDSGAAGAKLDCDLTMLVHLAPVFCIFDVNWEVFLRRLRDLSEKQRGNMEELGIQEGLIAHVSGADSIAF